MKNKLLSFISVLDPNNILTENEKALIIGASGEIRVRKNQIIQHIGQHCQSIYYVHKGGVKLYYIHNEVEVVDNFAFEGQIAVRFESYISKKPSRRAIQATENGILFAFDIAKLDAIFVKNPRIEVLFHRLFHISHVNLIERLEYLQFHTASERYHSLLTRYPDLLQRLPLKAIASYLGITAVSFSRLRANICH